MGVAPPLETHESPKSSGGKGEEEDEEDVRLDTGGELL